MDRLWAPWRMQYIQDVDKKDDGCVFCKAPLSADDRKSLILYRGKYCFVIMNLFPYNNGHLMIIPYVHTSDIMFLDHETTSEMWKLLCDCKTALVNAFNPEGFNIGMNLGRVAGAGIDTHVHMHIVPRWNGDTNFIPVLSDTKVISQGLNETYDALKVHFDKIG